MRFDIDREWCERMASREGDHDVTIGGEMIGACEHGYVVHYRYPCRRCFGNVGYLRQRF